MSGIDNLNNRVNGNYQIAGNFGVNNNAPLDPYQRSSFVKADDSVFVSNNLYAKPLGRDFVNILAQPLFNTWNSGLSNYLQALPADNKDIFFIADPSQENKIVSEGQSYWMLAAVLLAEKDPAKAQQYKQKFDGLFNGLKEMIRLSQSRGNKGVFPAWAVAIKNGKLVPNDKLPGPLNSASDADLDMFKALLKAREVFKTEEYDKFLEAYLIPNNGKPAPAQALFIKKGPYYVLKPSEDWNDFVFVDYFCPGTAVEISKFLESRGHKKDAAEWTKIAKGNFDLLVDIIKITGEVPARAQLEITEKGLKGVNVLDHQSFDGIRGPWRLADSLQYKEILDPKFDSKKILQKYLSNWDKTSGEVGVLRPVMYLPLAYALNDEKQAEILEKEAIKNFKNGCVYEQKDKYYEMTLSMLSLLDISRTQKAESSFFNGSSLDKAEKVQRSFDAKVFEVWANVKNYVVDSFRNFKHRLYDLGSNKSAEYKAWVDKYYKTQEINGITCGYIETTAETSPVLMKNGIKTAMTSKALSEGLMLAVSNGDSLKFWQLFSTIKNLSKNNYFNTDKTTRMLPWAVNEKLETISVYEKDFVLPFKEGLPQFIAKYNARYKYEKYRYEGKTGPLSVKGKIENAEEIAELKKCYQAEKGSAMEKRIDDLVSSSYENYGRLVLDCRSSATDADLDIIVALTKAYQNISMNANERKELLSWINLFSAEFSKNSVQTVSNVSGFSDKENKDIYVLKSGCFLKFNYGEMEYYPAYANLPGLKTLADFYNGENIGNNDMQKAMFFKKLADDTSSLNKKILKGNKEQWPVKVTLYFDAADNNGEALIIGNKVLPDKNSFYYQKNEWRLNEDYFENYKNNSDLSFNAGEYEKETEFVLRKDAQKLFVGENKNIDPLNMQFVTPSSHIGPLLLNIQIPQENYAGGWWAGRTENSFIDYIQSVEKNAPDQDETNWDPVKDNSDWFYRQYLMLMGSDTAGYAKMLDKYIMFRTEMYGDQKEAILDQLYQIGVSRRYRELEICKGCISDATRMLFYKLNLLAKEQNYLPMIRQSAVVLGENEKDGINGDFAAAINGNVQEIEKTGNTDLLKIAIENNIRKELKNIYVKKGIITNNDINDLWRKYENTGHYNLYGSVSDTDQKKRANFQAMFYAKVIFHKGLSREVFDSAAEKLLANGDNANVLKALTLRAAKKGEQAALLDIANVLEGRTDSPRSAYASILNKIKTNSAKDASDIALMRKDWYAWGSFVADISNMMYLVSSSSNNPPPLTQRNLAEKILDKEFIGLYKNKGNTYWENHHMVYAVNKRIQIEKTAGSPVLFNEAYNWQRELARKKNEAFDYKHYNAYAYIRTAQFQILFNFLQEFGRDDAVISEINYILNDPIVKSIDYVHEPLQEQFTKWLNENK